MLSHLKRTCIVNISIMLILLLVCNLSTLNVIEARKLDTSGPAEVNAYVDGDIPSIKTAWTPINITVVDAFGIDWDRLSSTLPEWWMRFIWPLNPQFPQPIQRLLGYTGLRFIPEIIEGDARGWYVKVTPTSISQSNPGRKHSLVLDVRTDDSAIDYDVIVGVKCLRLDLYGEPIGSSYITIPVKASPLNFVEMKTLHTTSKAGLKTVVKLDFDITNKGYYKDVFQFDIKTENGLVALVDQQAVTLNSGETKRITLSVRTPEKLYDVGTGNKIDIYVYSKGDPNKILVGSMVIITEGFYVSPLVGIVTIPIIIVLLLITLFYFYLRNKRISSYIAKPDKPWNIPEERAYLEELKNKDKKEYEKVLGMMEEEYQSAMLWYKDSVENLKREMKKERTWMSGRLYPSKKEKTDDVEKEDTTSGVKVREGEKTEEKIRVEQKELDVKTDKSIMLDEDKERKEKLLRKVKREEDKMKKQ
ncbi:MAG: hypothetical protein QXS02_03660 [Candidatus Thermoplasmatota archaeon]